MRPRQLRRSISASEHCAHDFIELPISRRYCEELGNAIVTTHRIDFLTLLARLPAALSGVLGKVNRNLGLHDHPDFTCAFCRPFTLPILVLDWWAPSLAPSTTSQLRNFDCYERISLSQSLHSPFPHSSQELSTFSAEWREKSPIRSGRTSVGYLMIKTQRTRKTTVVSGVRQMPSQMNRDCQHHPRAEKKESHFPRVQCPFQMTTCIPRALCSTKCLETNNTEPPNQMRVVFGTTGRTM